MVNCEWASALTRYDCRPLRTLTGDECLEIGTPFSLPDGSAINLYLKPLESTHVMISDNGDTMLHLSGMGIDVWNGKRLQGLRDAIANEAITLDSRGDFRLIAQAKNASVAFARAITGLLTVNHWAHEQLKSEPPSRDLPAEAEAYIIARAPGEELIKNKKIKGASKTEYTFDFLHGGDLIDVISPSAQGTGIVMRKVGDVINGPFIEPYSTLVIVDDRFDPIRADKEISILASLTRTQSFTNLMRITH